MKTHTVVIWTEGSATWLLNEHSDYAVLHNGEPVSYNIAVLARYLSVDRRDLACRIRRAAGTSKRAAVNVGSIKRARPWSRLRKDGTQSRRPQRRKCAQ